MRFSIHGLSLSLVSLVLVAPALAEEATTLTLDPVVVTASRVQESNFKTPYQVEAISSETILREAIRSLPEAFNRTPGVIVQKTSNGQGSPIIRGVTGYHNLYLVDGVRLNNAAFRSGPNQYANTIDIQGLESLELVKSQGSVLYGSDAVGGTIQALTRRPVYSEQGGALLSGRTYSRYASAENSFIQRGEVSYAVSEQWGLILGGTFKDFGDIEAADLGTLPFTGYREWDADAKLEVFVNPDTTVTVFHQSVEIDDAWRVHKTREAVSWKGTTVGDERSRILDQRRHLSYLQIEGAVSASPFFDRYQVGVSYQQQEEERSRVRSDGRLDVQGFELGSIGLSSQFEKSTSWGDLVYGGSYYRDEADTYRADFNADGSFRGSQPQGPFGNDATYHLGAAFVNASVPIGDRLDVDLGLRGTYAKADIGTVIDPGTGDVFSIRDDWQNVVGSLRFDYQLDEADTVRLFGGFSQAFRAPNFSDLSRLDSNRSTEVETPSPGLSPEEFLTFEVGFKAERGPFSGVLSYFYTDVDDLILRTPTGRAFDGDLEVIKQNVGDGHFQGVELNAAWEAASGWTLFGGFAYHDGQISTFPTSAPVLVEEYPSRILPTHGFGGVRWESADGRFWAEGVARVVDDADRLSSSDRRDTQRIPPGGTPGYVMASLRSGWHVRDGVHITAAVENLFDEAYRAHGSGQNEPGRNFVFGLELKF